MRKLHLGAIQEKKENGKKLKIVDSSLIEKNACFFGRKGFSHNFLCSSSHQITSCLQPLNTESCRQQLSQLHIITQGDPQSLWGLLLVLYATKSRLSPNVVHLLGCGYVLCMLCKNASKPISTKKHAFFSDSGVNILPRNEISFPDDFL